MQEGQGGTQVKREWDQVEEGEDSPAGQTEAAVEGAPIVPEVRWPLLKRAVPAGLVGWQTPTILGPEGEAGVTALCLVALEGLVGEAGA